MIKLRNRNIKISLLDNEGGFFLECSSWVDAMFLDHKALVNMMISDMKSYMEKHRKHILNFKETCGYYCADCFLGYFKFCNNEGHELRFDNVSEKNFVLVCKLYDAFFNHSFMPIEED